MKILIALFVGLLTGTLGFFVAGFYGAAYCKWYRVSTFEGAAGYVMAAIAMLGAILGLIIAGVVSRFIAVDSTPGFFKGLGVSCGLVIGIAAITTVISWLLADIPPKIGGRYLNLEVEIRLPVGQTNPPTSVIKDPKLTLGSVINHKQRKSEDGELRLAEARFENGRWIVPGSVRVFTMRGRRSIYSQMGSESVQGFLVPLPARPGKKFENWSEWEPRPRGGATWPDTNPSYRFRVQRVLPPPPEPDPAIVEAERFAALKPDAPLEQWLVFLRREAPEDRNQSILKVVNARQPELAKLIASTNCATREMALNTVMNLSRVSPEVSEAVLAEGRQLGSALKDFNQMKSDDPDFYNVQVALRSRFSYWHHAWWRVHQITRVDGRPPVQEILDLARVRAKDTSMDEIVINAEAHLRGLEPVAQNAQ